MGSRPDYLSWPPVALRRLPSVDEMDYIIHGPAETLPPNTRPQQRPTSTSTGLGCPYIAHHRGERGEHGSSLPNSMTPSNALANSGMLSPTHASSSLGLTQFYSLSDSHNENNDNNSNPRLGHHSQSNPQPHAHQPPHFHSLSQSQSHSTGRAPYDPVHPNLHTSTHRFSQHPPPPPPPPSQNPFWNGPPPPLPQPQLPVSSASRHMATGSHFHQQTQQQQQPPHTSQPPQLPPFDQYLGVGLGVDMGGGGLGVGPGSGSEPGQFHLGLVPPHQHTHAPGAHDPYDAFSWSYRPPNLSHIHRQSEGLQRFPAPNISSHILSTGMSTSGPPSFMPIPPTTSATSHNMPSRLANPNPNASRPTRQTGGFDSIDFPRGGSQSPTARTGDAAPSPTSSSSAASSLDGSSTPPHPRPPTLSQNQAVLPPQESPARAMNGRAHSAASGGHQQPQNLAQGGISGVSGPRSQSYIQDPSPGRPNAQVPQPGPQEPAPATAGRDPPAGHYGNNTHGLFPPRGPGPHRVPTAAGAQPSVANVPVPLYGMPVEVAVTMNAEQRLTAAGHAHRRPATIEVQLSDEDSDSGDEPMAEDAFIQQLAGTGPNSQYAVERVRTQQLLRGAITNKRVASKSAISSLQSVLVDSLPENERMCVICYNEFGVENPEGINEAPLRLPKCKHVFGDHCIKKWFEESDSCPYCRDKVPSEPLMRLNARSMRTLFGSVNPAAAPGSSARNAGDSMNHEALVRLYQGATGGTFVAFGGSRNVSAWQTSRRSPPDDQDARSRRTRPRHGSLRGSPTNHGTGAGSASTNGSGGSTRPNSFGGNPVSTSSSTTTAAAGGSSSTAAPTSSSSQQQAPIRGAPPPHHLPYFSQMDMRRHTTNQSSRPRPMPDPHSRPPPMFYPYFGSHRPSAVGPGGMSGFLAVSPDHPMLTAMETSSYVPAQANPTAESSSFSSSPSAPSSSSSSPNSMQDQNMDLSNSPNNNGTSNNYSNDVSPSNPARPGTPDGPVPRMAGGGANFTAPQAAPVSQFSHQLPPVVGGLDGAPSMAFPAGNSGPSGWSPSVYHT